MINLLFFTLAAEQKHAIKFEFALFQAENRIIGPTAASKIYDVFSAKQHFRVIGQ